MRFFLVVIIILSLLGCNKPDISGNFSGPVPLRLAFFDSLDNNLLDPNNHNNFGIDNLKFSDGKNLRFELKNTIGGNSIEFYYLESIWIFGYGSSFDPDTWNCVNSECEFYITYSNSVKNDTISLLYEEVLADDDGDPILAYPRKYIKLNGTDIDEFESEYTGAAIIRK